MNYRWNDARFMTGLKRDFHFNDTPLLPPSLLPFVRLDVSINEEEGIQLYGERKLEQKGPIKEWPKSKHRLIVDERWWEEGKVACKIYTKTIHFLRDSTSVNCNQRLRNELNKIQEEFSFPFSFNFQNKQRTFIFFSMVPFIVVIHHFHRMDEI